MAKKRNIIVGQSGGPTAVINSSLAGVYKNAIERGFDKVYGMLHGIQGLLDEQYIDLSTQIHSELDIELLKRTPSAFLGSCRYKLPEIHEDKAIYEKIFEILNKLDIYAFIYIGGNDSMDTIQKLEKQGIQVKVSDISDVMNLPRPGVTRTVKEMETKGYLHKFASKEDGRVTYISITDEGRKLSQKYDRDYFSELAFSLSDISEEDANCMIRTIEKFYQIMCERRKEYDKR